MDNLTVQSVIFDKSVFNPRKARKWLNNSGYKAPKMDETEGHLRFRQLAPSAIHADSYITKALGNSGVKLILGKAKLSGGMNGDDDESNEDRKRRRIMERNPGFRIIPTADQQAAYYAERTRILGQLRAAFDAKLRGLIHRIAMLSVSGLYPGPKIADLKASLSRIVEASQGNMGESDMEDQSIEIDNLIEEIGRRFPRIGGKMKANAIADFIDASYSKKPPKELDGFLLDSKLSTDYAKVYYQPSTGEARVVHRGTEGLADWGNNLAYLAGAYNYTDRYKQGKKVQDAAEKKYGKKNISTLGHSQGAVLARKLGSDTKEVINVNPAFKGEIPKKNEYNIRSDADVVSGLYAPVAKIRSILTPGTSKKHDITIAHESKNPLSEHSADITRRLGDKEIGVGAGRRVAGRTSDIINWYLA